MARAKRLGEAVSSSPFYLLPPPPLPPLVIPLPLTLHSLCIWMHAWSVYIHPPLTHHIASLRHQFSPHYPSIIDTPHGRNALMHNLCLIFVAAVFLPLPEYNRNRARTARGAMDPFWHPSSLELTSGTRSPDYLSGRTSLCCYVIVDNICVAVKLQEGVTCQFIPTLQ
jgi:hypothetical protein